MRMVVASLSWNPFSHWCDVCGANYLPSRVDIRGRVDSHISFLRPLRFALNLARSDDAKILQTPVPYLLEAGGGGGGGLTSIY